jgi:hypothetical protein
MLRTDGRQVALGDLIAHGRDTIELRREDRFKMGKRVLKWFPAGRGKILPRDLAGCLGRRRNNVHHRGHSHEKI